MTPLVATRLLAVMPHPDDEAYAAAGTLARAADRGAATAVLCATRGERGGDPDLRAQELSAACAAIGAERLPTLGWPDGGVASLDRADPVATLLALGQAIDAWRPDVVLGLGADGVYGHLDHLGLHRVLRAVAAESTGRWHSFALWEAAFPSAHFHPVWRALRRQRFQGVVKGWTAETFGAAPLASDVCVDVRMVADRKRAAIAAHASQLGGRAPEDFLRPGLMRPLLALERWREAGAPVAVSERP